MFRELGSERKASVVRKRWVGGAWVAQAVERPALDFSSGHDLGPGIKLSSLGSTLSGESA